MVAVFPEELASEPGFRADPDRVWRWYRERRDGVSRCQPNAAHHAIARLEQTKIVTLVTQNVDGLHQRAGSQAVVELHGNIARAKCFDGCGWSGQASVLDRANLQSCPRCPQCGAWARPDVVWFGEMLDDAHWSAAVEAVLRCDICLVIGTSALVEPAARLPHLARAHGASIVVVNPDVTEIDTIAEFSLHASAGEILPRLIP